MHCVNIQASVVFEPVLTYNKYWPDNINLLTYINHDVSTATAKCILLTTVTS